MNKTNVRDSATYRKLQTVLNEMRDSPVFRIAGSNISIATVMGRRVLFSVPTPTDFIQQFHHVGAFYEAEELSTLHRFFPEGGVFVDIGANVGNHALYVGLFLAPSRIIPFEPNRTAVKILFENLGLNDLLAITDLSHLGLGLSNQSGAEFRAETPLKGNLGMTHLVEGGGDIPLTTADEALAAEARIDLIKIDVEGMEMRVLAGLARTLTRTRPHILIEVDHGNRAAFDAWLGTAGYAVEHAFAPQPANQNLILRPS